MPNVTVLAREWAGIQARVYRTPGEAEVPLLGSHPGGEAEYDEREGSEGRERQDASQVVAVGARHRAAASSGAQEGPGLSRQWDFLPPLPVTRHRGPGLSLLLSPALGELPPGSERSMWSWMARAYIRPLLLGSLHA